MNLFRYNLDSLKVLGSVGEPINPEAWWWYYKHIGKEKCSIADTFWQTETGGHVITPLPGCTPMKPGSAVSIQLHKTIPNKYIMYLLIFFLCMCLVFSILWCETNTFG